jgi:uncharacterized protein
MSITDKSVAVAERLYALFGAGDIPGVIALFAEDALWIEPGPPDKLAWAGTFRGPTGIGEFFARVAATLDILEFTTHETVAQGEHVVVFGREVSRVKATGKSFTSDFVHHYTVKDGKIRSLRFYHDTAAMVTAASQDAG